MAGVACLNLGADWLLGGLTAEESMNRGRPRNGVLVLTSLGVDMGSANWCAFGAGVLCVPLSSTSISPARASAASGGDDGIGSSCANTEVKGVVASTRRLLLPSLVGANSASNSASRMPGVSGSSGGVLSMASSGSSLAFLVPVPACLVTSTSSESSMTSRWRERVALCEAGGSRVT
jgi:hypothetical protein